MQKGTRHVPLGPLRSRYQHEFRCTRDLLLGKWLWRIKGREQGWRRPFRLQWRPDLGRRGPPNFGRYAAKDRKVDPWLPMGLSPASDQALSPMGLLAQAYFCTIRDSANRWLWLKDPLGGSKNLPPQSPLLFPLLLMSGLGNEPSCIGKGSRAGLPRAAFSSSLVPNASSSGWVPPSLP